MLQQVMTAPGKIIFREIPKPEPAADEVVVKIMKIGVCGSDIHVYHGKHPFTKYPVTQGHEVSGRIESVGSDVHDVLSVILLLTLCEKSYILFSTSVAFFVVFLQLVSFSSHLIKYHPGLFSSGRGSSGCGTRSPFASVYVTALLVAELR